MIQPSLQFGSSRFDDRKVQNIFSDSASQSGPRNMKEPASDENLVCMHEDFDETTGRKTSYMVILLVLAFLFANTFFLVSEHSGFYQSLGYSFAFAWFIAATMEFAMLLLPSLAAGVEGLWKIILMAVLGVCVVVSFQVLDESARERGRELTSQDNRVKRLQESREALKSVQAPIIARIKFLDPNHNRTEINRLTSKLENRQNGISHKISQIDAELDKLVESRSGSAAVAVMLWQRRALLLVNLVLAGFLGALRKKGIRFDLNRGMKFLGIKI